MKTHVLLFFHGFVCLCCCFVVHITHTQNDAPSHPVDGEYIKEWLVLGPFFPNNLDTDFLADAGGEANIQPQEGDTVTAADGTTLTWKRYTTKGNSIDLIDAVGDHEYATAYAYCRLQSQVAGGRWRNLRIWPRWRTYMDKWQTGVSQS